MRKRIACFHDLASFGGAALMNIIPIMYSEGIEVCPIPTALFTSHGAIKGSRAMEVSEFFKEYLNHYRDLKLSFNGIYLGFFKSSSQIIMAEVFLDCFGENKLVLLDPIMGDNGKLYNFVNKENVENMKRLVKKAGIITPNLTEACALLDMAYKEGFREDEIKGILYSLGDLGPDNIILTSVTDNDYIYTYIYNKKTVKVIKGVKRPGFYPGCGDVFSAMVMALMLKGKDIFIAAKEAVELIERGIDLSVKSKYSALEGLPLAELLGKKEA